MNTEKTEHVKYPTPMSEICAVYFRNSCELISFVSFICGVVLDIEKKAKIAAEAQLKVLAIINDVTDPVSLDEKDEEVASYKRTINDGVGAQKFLSNRSYLILEMMISKGTDNFLSYISDLLALIFKTKPETLKSKEMVRTDAILEHKTMEEFIAYLAEEKVNSLSYLGMKNLNDDLLKKLDFSLFENEEELKRAVSIVEFRNLIVHNRGIINKRFLNKLPDYPGQVGERLIFKVKDVFDHVAFLDNAVKEIELKAVAKFKIPQTVATL